LRQGAGRRANLAECGIKPKSAEGWRASAFSPLSTSRRFIAPSHVVHPSVPAAPLVLATVTATQSLPDEVYKRAVEAGAEVIYELMDQRYGDSEVSVKYLAGTHWYISHRLNKIAPVEGLHTVTAYLHLKGAHKMSDFLEQGFGAQEVFRSESERVIHHASIRVGDSIISIGVAS